ncbi:MAG: phosphate uptake regulator PhoU [bacterium]
MLKQIIEIWRSRRTESRLYSEFVEMLEMDWEMFEIVMEVLAGHVQADTVQDDLLRRDIQINRKERSIRKQIVERMSLRSGGTVPASLVLMSVVKDAERVGDYCKNLLEVAQMLSKPVSELRYCGEVIEFGQHVTQIFKSSIRAFVEEDADLAREIIQDEELMNKRCDRLVEAIARSDLDANEAVCTALWIRFLKRIEAHLSNICSSLVLPVHRLDYRLKYVKKADGTVEERLDGDEAPGGGDTPK